MTPTTLGIPEFAIRTFDQRWELVVQQLESKLRDKAMTDEFEGKQKAYTDIGTLNWTEETGRLSRSNPQQIDGAKRVLTKRSFHCQAIFDRNDKDYLVKELTTPGSETEMSMRASWNRNVDDLIIGNVLNTVYGGAEPYTTPITVPSGQFVAVDYVTSGSAVNSGLTPAKMQRLVKIFEDNNVEFGSNSVSGYVPDPVWLAIGTQQKQDLWAFVESAPNAPWANMIGAWLTDQTKKLFGFSAIVSNRLQVDNTGIRTCIAWSPRGVKVVPDKFELRIDQLPERNHAIQMAAYTQYGVMRRHEELVGAIYADESP